MSRARRKQMEEKKTFDEKNKKKTSLFFQAVFKSNLADHRCLKNHDWLSHIRLDAFLLQEQEVKSDRLVIAILFFSICRTSAFFPGVCSNTASASRRLCQAARAGGAKQRRFAFKR